MKRRVKTKPCEYGVLNITCGKPSVTIRPRPASKGLNGPRWHVCQFHADALDRVRASIVENKELLDRLEEA